MPAPATPAPIDPGSNLAHSRVGPRGSFGSTRAILKRHMFWRRWGWLVLVGTWIAACDLNPQPEVPSGGVGGAHDSGIGGGIGLDGSTGGSGNGGPAGLGRGL